MYSKVRIVVSSWMLFDIVCSLEAWGIARNHLLAFLLVPPHVVETYGSRKNQVLPVDPGPRITETHV